MEPDSSFATKVAEEAASAISHIVETHYTHTIIIDHAAGIYDCDCSGFVEHLLSRTFSDHLTPLFELSAPNRPQADIFYDFLASLPTAAQSAGINGWRQVITLEAVARGDVLAWKLHGSEERGDTGHVVVVAEVPTRLTGETDGAGQFALEVYDSSVIEHFDDSRGSGPSFKSGVGSGIIHIEVDAQGAPIAFQFHEAAQWHCVPIAVGRIEPFSSRKTNI